MNHLEDLLARAVAQEPVADAEWIALLGLRDPEACAMLFHAAYEVKKRYVGAKVYLRGLVEVSNLCTKNCYYCGIRRGNEHLTRFCLDRHEIVDTALQALDFHYGSVVLQAGERTDSRFADDIAEAVAEIKSASDGRLGITLSLGEQEKPVYATWFAAGAHRYLLRIEASNPALYARLHPADHSHAERLRCLELLRECGYQVGTGVMAGLPTQTLEDLWSDIRFFRDFDIDMIGMGPYLMHHDTPMPERFPDFHPTQEAQLSIGLKMIAVTRLFLRDVNIASTTALQALSPHGREEGLLAGANIIMPNLTSVRYREGYKLYDNKPGTDENAETSRDKLIESIARIGETIGFDEWGDSRHFQNRVK